MIRQKPLDEIKKQYGGYWRYDFLDFHYLYNPYFPTENMILALKDNLHRLIDFYPSTQKVIANILSNWDSSDYFNESNLIVGNGTSELLKLLIRKMKNVILPIPTFNEYLELPSEQLTLFMTCEDENFQINEERLCAFVEAQKKDYLVLVNPNNPTGQVISKNTIERCLQSGTTVVVDEAFIDWNGREASCEPLVTRYQNLIILKSLTKAAGCGGLRIGYMLTTNEDMLNYMRENLPIWNVNGVAEQFLELLVQNKTLFLEGIRRSIEDREDLKSALSQIQGVSVLNSGTSFLLCKTPYDARELEFDLFQNSRIMIKGGIKQAGIDTNHFFRVGVRTPEDNKMLLGALRGWFEQRAS